MTDCSLGTQFKTNAVTVAFRIRWLQAMTSYQVEYTPPLSTDRNARVRVSRGDDGTQVGTRELSDDEGPVESQMVHWIIEHKGVDDRGFIDPGGWRVDLTDTQHAEFKLAFEVPQHSRSPS